MNLLRETEVGEVGATKRYRTMRHRAAGDLEAKERQKLSKGPGIKGVVNLPHLSEKARDSVGKAVGVSGKSIDYATRV